MNFYNRCANLRLTILARHRLHGESPFFLNAGYDPLTAASFLNPSSRRGNEDAENSSITIGCDNEILPWITCVTDCLIAALGKHSTVTKEGDVGSEFLLTPEARNRPCDKLRPRWYGPFKVLEKISPNAIRLELPHQLKWLCHPVFNVTALKKHHESGQFDGRYTSPPPPITDLDGFERYIVQEFPAHRRIRRGLQYLVKWVGYPDATWEPGNFLKKDGEDLVPMSEYKNKCRHW